MNASGTADSRLVPAGVVRRDRNLLMALCAAAALCSLSPALDLGLTVGTDGITSATSPLRNVYLYSEELPDKLPLAAAAFCDLHSGEHFVLRVKTTYGVLQHMDSTTRYGETDRTGLHAFRVQVAPSASVDIPGIPVYLLAGLGCGAHWSWTRQTHDGDVLENGTTRGLDAAGLLAVGFRVNPRLTLELGVEELLADWTGRTGQTYVWEDSSRVWSEVSKSSGAAFNLSGVVQPGYSAGIVWTR